MRWREPAASPDCILAAIGRDCPSDGESALEDDDLEE
jgi:hypothetical protein